MAVQQLIIIYIKSNFTLLLKFVANLFPTCAQLRTVLIAFLCMDISNSWKQVGDEMSGGECVIIVRGGI